MTLEKAAELGPMFIILIVSIAYWLGVLSGVYIWRKK